MKSILPAKLSYMLLLSYIFILMSSVSGQDKEWRPIPANQLAAKTSVVEPDADAEALLWEMRIDDSSSDGLSRRHYVRVKIFNERGREKYSKFDIPYYKGMKIKDLAARVVKADGTSVEIAKSDIFEREIVKAGGVKIKAKSFAVPNIEPGVIIEYRYKESIEDGGAKGSRLAFQRDIPVQSLEYYYKPYSSKEPKYQSYNFNDAKFVKDTNGYWRVTRTNVPAFREEPRMPPEDTVRPWMLLTGTQLELTSVSAFSFSYTIKDPSNLQSYWGGVSAERTGLLKFITKPDSDIKKAAQEITAGASTAEDKLKKIYEFCQTQIRNTDFDTTLTDEDKRKLPPVKSIGDVLKRKSGRSSYVDMLFGAMASSLGYDIKLVLTGNKSEMFFEPAMTNESLLHPAAIAVEVDKEWKYYNPGMKFAPYGMLVWYEEGGWAMLIGEKNYLWKKTPATDHKITAAKRHGKFKLMEDGTLEGTIKVELGGHLALSYRLENYDESVNKLEEDLKASIKGRMSTAEISEVSIENLTDAAKPLVQNYKVRIPSYAQKTGKRLFLQPGFFEYGENAMFSSATRKYDIFFRYPWSESDDIDIQLPPNFELDNADSPGAASDPNKIGSLEVKMSIEKSKQDSFLAYKREFYFGGGGNTLFPATVYPALKGLFDLFHKSDSHTVTLKQK